MAPTDLTYTVLRTRADFERACSGSAHRLAYEQALAAAHRDLESWTVLGYCQACDAVVDLRVDWLYSGGEQPNWRERLLCPRCEMNSRQRFVAHLLRERVAPHGTIYLYEQVTAFSAWAAGRFPRVIGSEYLGHDVAPGTVVDGLRHEDALALSFADSSLAAIVSNDVFEHVPDIDRALAEAARALQADGLLLFSVPFHGGRDETIQRATIRDGSLVALLPEVYHGNPMSEQGSLVFYDYGWSLLDRCRAAGFADVYAIGYWSALYGHLGNGLQLTFAAHR